MKNTLPILILGLFVISNYSCEQDASPECGGEYVVINSVRYADAPDDDFFLTDVSISGNCMNIAFQYSGGCGDIRGELIDADVVEAGNPIRRDLRFSFRDQDNCEALINSAFKYDLTPLQVEGETQIRLRLEGWSGLLMYNY